MPRLLRYLLILLAVFLAVYFTQITWRNLEPVQGFDFYIYYVNAQIAGRSDIENIYAPEAQVSIGEEFYARAQYSGSDRQWEDAKSRRRLDSVSSPFLYTSLGWLSPVYERAIRHYRWLLIGSFIAGTLIFCTLGGLPATGTFFLLAFLIGWYFPFHGDLIVGNVNSLQLVTIALALAAARRWPPLAGFLFGLLLSFKPNLVLVLFLLVAARIATREHSRLRSEILGGAIGGLTAFAVTAFHYRDVKVWFYWLSAAGQFWERFPPRGHRNIAPALPLFQKFGSWPSYLIAGLLIAIVVTVLFRTRKRDDLLVVSLGVLIYLLSATVVWVHYLVLAVPAAVALMRRRSTALLGVGALILMAGNPLEAILRRSMIPVEAMIDFAALLLLFAAGVWMLATPRERQSPTDANSQAPYPSDIAPIGMTTNSGTS